MVQRPSETELLESFFLIVDLAGSEGETAFTEEFKASVDAKTLMGRRLEAGVINTGLSQLQIIFNQLKEKGCLSKVKGMGLRRVLHEYINTRCVLSVLFCVSPCSSNDKSTSSTLKFAVQAGMVRCTPVAEKKKVNYKELVRGLRATIETLKKALGTKDAELLNKNTQIQELDEQIQEFEEADKIQEEEEAAELQHQQEKLAELTLGTNEGVGIQGSPVLASVSPENINNHSKMPAAAGMARRAVNESNEPATWCQNGGKVSSSDAKAAAKEAESGESERDKYLGPEIKVETKRKQWNTPVWDGDGEDDEDTDDISDVEVLQ